MCSSHTPNITGSCGRVVTSGGRACAVGSGPTGRWLAPLVVAPIGRTSASGLAEASHLRENTFENPRKCVGEDSIAGPKGCVRAQAAAPESPDQAPA
jgi:hypothetical protein